MKKENNACSLRANRVGGQAVLEGVMMKAANKCSTACRIESGDIVVDDREFVSIRKKYKFLNIPILRGIVNFVEMLILSYSTLTVSAELMGVEEEESKAEKWFKKHLGVGLFDVIMVIAMVLGIGLAVGLFIYLPTVAVSFFARLASVDLGNLRAIPEGIIRIGIFVLYIYLVSLMPDIKRTFEYHGAEHKSIACFEAGEELTPENAKKHTRFHPRCGTSFMFVMILLGIIVGFCIRLVFPEIEHWLYVCIRLLILPLVVGIGYEFIRFAGNHDGFMVRALSAPGLWMQRITTREPDEEMLEIALTALMCAMPDEFPDFDELTYDRSPKKATEDTAEVDTIDDSQAPTEEPIEEPTEAPQAEDETL